MENKVIQGIEPGTEDWRERMKNANEAASQKLRDKKITPQKKREKK